MHEDVLAMFDEGILYIESVYGLAVWQDVGLSVILFTKNRRRSILTRLLWHRENTVGGATK